MEEASWTVHQATRPPTLWLLIDSEVISGMSIGPHIIQRIPYMTALGFSVAYVRISFGIYNACAFVAEVAWGLLGDRFPTRLSAVFASLGGAVSILVGVGATNVWRLYGMFGALCGLTGEALVMIGPRQRSDRFGRRYQGSIRGVISPFGPMANLGGSTFAALIFDHYGSYHIASGSAPVTRGQRRFVLVDAEP